MKNFWKRALGLVLAMTLLLSLCCPAMAATSFDDTSGHWAEDVIEELVAEGIVQGCGNGMCRPDDMITRAQFAALVARAFHYETDKPCSFTDISGHWAEKNIAALANAGIIVQTEYGELYEPDLGIARIEMVKMMDRVLSNDKTAAAKRGATDFTDDAEIKSEDSGYINLAKYHGIINGYPDGSFRPYREASRAEGFVLLKRLRTEQARLQAEKEKEPTYVYIPEAQISFTLPTNAYAGDEITVKGTSKYARTVTWELKKTGAEDTLAVDGLQPDGGVFLLDEPGEYTLTATAVNSVGHKATCAKQITVYPVSSVAFRMPGEEHVGAEIEVSLTGAFLEGLPVTWAASKDGMPITIADHIDGELGDAGGQVSFRDPGRYELSVSVTDALGKVYTDMRSITIYPVPEITFSMPAATYIGQAVSIEASSTSSNMPLTISEDEPLTDLGITWTVKRNGADVAAAEYIAGSLAGVGGTVSFSSTGTYTLTATITDAMGASATCVKTITVYPILAIDFALQRTAHTDTTIVLDLETEFVASEPVTWQVEKDGDEVSLSDVATGYLNRGGGEVCFAIPGEYRLTASVVDALGTEYSCTRELTVYPVASITLTAPTATHTDETADIIVSGNFIDELPVSWSIEKNGARIEPDDHISGDLTDSGGSLCFRERGTYRLIATVTDATGRVYTAACRITSYPVGTVGFFLPTVFHTDDTVAVEVSVAELADNPLVWTLERNGVAVEPADYIDGTLTTGHSTIRIVEQGDYTLFASFTDGGGRSYSYSHDFKVYPVIDVTYSIPAAAHTSDVFTVVPRVENLGALDIEWLVDNTYGYQDWATYVDGTLGNAGGAIRFKRAGTYEIVARVTDELGRVFLFEIGAICEVQPVLAIHFALPALVPDGTEIDIRTSGNNNVLPVDWSLTKDGAAVDIAEYITGHLNDYGGRITFTTYGHYTLTATLDDVLGQTFSHSESIYVYPVASYQVDLPERAHIGSTFSVDTTGEHLEDCTLTWSLTKDGRAATLPATLTMDGGTLTFNTTGTYVLTASLTDQFGNVYTASDTVVVYNNSPAAPSAAVAVNYADCQNGYTTDYAAKVSVTVTGGADPDGDRCEYQYDGSSASSGYFKAGTYTVKVRSVDEWGKASNWTTTSFTVAPPATSYTISTPASVHIGNTFAVTANNTTNCAVNSWTLKKNGSAVSFDSSPLALNGGSLRLTETGSFTLTASVTDLYGRSYNAQTSFEILNSKPAAPTVTISTNYADNINAYTTNCAVKATITVSGGTDPDGDSISYEYASNPGGTGYYPLGTYTVKVRSVDAWGAASAWTTKSFTVATETPSVTLASSDLDAHFTTPNSNVTFTASVSSANIYKISSVDYYGAAGADVHADVSASTRSHTIRSNYSSGRHLLVVQVKDLFGSTAYASQFFAVGNTTNSENASITSMSTTVTENGLYDGSTPLAYISDFTLSIPAISGHSSGCSDKVTVYGVTPSGAQELVFSCNTNDGFVYVSSDGTYKHTTSGSTQVSDTWTGWDPSSYCKLVFGYEMPSGHESCLSNATQGLTYTVSYAFIEGSTGNLEALFD